MANYKSIVDIESVAEATESMNVLVEDAGSLKKVPAGGMIGGGSGKTLIINYKEEAVPPKGLDSLATGTFTANMTYAEFSEAVMSGEFTGGILCWTNTDLQTFEYYILSYISSIGSSRHELGFFNFGGTVTLNFYNDNTITEVSDN